MVKKTGKRLLLGFSLSVIAVGTLLYFLAPSFNLAINNAASILATADIKRMRIFIRSFGIWAPIASMGIMIFQSLASPLPAFVVTFANAWVFGWKAGAFYSWTGAMLGAGICWAIGRSFGRPVVEKLVGGSSILDRTDSFFKDHGTHAILIARLLPVMPFDVVSYAAGLTTVTFWSFFWATGLGQLPATVLYSWWGENMTRSGKTFLWGITGFMVLLVAAWVFKRRAITQAAETEV